MRRARTSYNFKQKKTLEPRAGGAGHILAKGIPPVSSGRGSMRFMPLTKPRELNRLEVTLQLPVRHRLFILPPFPLAGGCVVVDEFVAEGLAGEGAFAK